jgi:hypothetical protein
MWGPRQPIAPAAGTELSPPPAGCVETPWKRRVQQIAVPAAATDFICSCRVQPDAPLTTRNVRGSMIAIILSAMFSRKSFA